jgi:hypothetical protein
MGYRNKTHSSSHQTTNLLSVILNDITIAILDIIHRPVFYLKQRFGDWILSPFYGGNYLVGPDRERHTKTEFG